MKLLIKWKMCIWDPYWAMICFVNFNILFMDRCYICMYHASWKGRAWQRAIKITIQEMGHDIYLFRDNFYKNICEMKLKLKVKLKSFFICSVIAFILGWFLYLLKAISTLLKLFSVKVALCFSANIPNILTILKKYSLNIFAILV